MESMTTRAIFFLGRMAENREMYRRSTKAATSGNGFIREIEEVANGKQRTTNASYLTEFCPRT